MPRLLPSVVVVVGLLAVATARALPTQLMYEASIGGSPVGALFFDLDQEVEGGCRYSMQWAFGDGIPSEQCFVDERTPVARAGCFQAASMPLTTLVSLPPAGIGCYGLDSDGQSAPVYALVLSERGTDGALTGVIQLDGPSGSIEGFKAAPQR